MRDFGAVVESSIEAIKITDPALSMQLFKMLLEHKEWWSLEFYTAETTPDGKPVPWILEVHVSDDYGVTTGGKWRGDEYSLEVAIAEAFCVANHLEHLTEISRLLAKIKKGDV